MGIDNLCSIAINLSKDLVLPGGNDIKISEEQMCYLVTGRLWSRSGSVTGYGRLL